MGLITDEEARGSSSDAEETLPLYEATRQLEDDALQCPEPKATPDEVRDFIVQVMLARGIGEDHARRVAARWTIGTGRELRNYPVAMFRDIFGSDAEDGWAVYKEVRVRYYKKEMAAQKIDKRSIAIFLVLSICLIVGGPVLIYSDPDNWWRVMPGFVIMILGMFGTIMFSICLGITTDPEKKAEQELQAGWYKAPGSQAGSG